MLTIEWICDHKCKHKCWQYSSNVIIRINSNVDEEKSSDNKRQTQLLTIESLCEHKRKHKCGHYSHNVIISVNRNVNNRVTIWS